MRHLVDLFILFAVAILLMVSHPVLGTVMLLVNAVFATQYWKTLLLLGLEGATHTAIRKVKAAVLAVLLTAVLVMVTENQHAPAASESVADLWNGEVFPMILALCFLSSVAMVALLTEKRKR